MSELVVIDHELSRFGFKYVHVMQMGAAVDKDAATCQFVPGEVPTDEVHRCAWEEMEIGAYHLALSWPAREVIHLRRQANPETTLMKETPAVLWWIGERSQLEEGKRVTLREAVDLAGTLFWLRLGRAPMRATVRKLPGNAEKTVMVENIGMVELLAAEWAPEGFVVVE